jgi:hypothetical protein
MLNSDPLRVVHVSSALGTGTYAPLNPLFITVQELLEDGIALTTLVTNFGLTSQLLSASIDTCATLKRKKERTEGK